MLSSHKEVSVAVYRNIYIYIKKRQEYDLRYGQLFWNNLFTYLTAA